MRSRNSYEGPADDSHGATIFPGLLPGAEEGPAGWGLWITGPTPGKGLLFAYASGFFGDMVYDKTQWNISDADIDDAVKAADAKLAKILNATEADLGPFNGRGGKLILFHGWDDPAISALNSINYYQSVVNVMGLANTGAFARLYMVPGMQHCGGTLPGRHLPDSLWPAQAVADRRKMRLTACNCRSSSVWRQGHRQPRPSRPKYVGRGPGADVQMTRPLCAFPQVAKYKGSGDTNDAANFACVAAE